ncbi:MAG: hypothetical protein K0M45_08540 [Candidatus Paracaedibacteraceae bacterium]|nr:hypothetical protein [Candidatus Paracaedibacteraceae bacterium]
MNKILMSAAVILGLSHIAMAEGTKAPEKLEQKEQALVKSERDEKKSAKKDERAHKILAACEKDLNKAEDQGKLLRGLDKKRSDLLIAHAKLERDAAKDPEMEADMLQSARLCKRYVGKAKKIEKPDDRAAIKEEGKK